MICFAKDYISNRLKTQHQEKDVSGNRQLVSTALIWNWGRFPKVKTGRPDMVGPDILAIK